MIHDRDTKFTASFDDVLKAGNVKVQKSAYRSPNTVAFVERFSQTLQQEALDHFIVLGEKHFDYLVSEYLAYYHTERPHQALGNASLTGEWPEPPEDDPPDTIPIECRTRLGGLLKSYERRAA